MKKKKKVRPKKVKTVIVLNLVIIIFIVAIVFFFLSEEKVMSDFKILDESEKINDAKKYGDDIVGWLRVEGTNIDLPLVGAGNDDVDVSKADYDFAWTNAFPDENSNRPAFISHNIRNVSSNPIIDDDTMTRFEQLMSFIYLDFTKDNQFIEYTNSEGETSIYRIYGVALLEDDQNSSYSDTYTEAEQKRYLKKVKRESMYDIDVDVDSDDLLLTLFTCTRFYGASTNYSFRVDARKLRDDEEKVYAKVEPNENYDKIKERMEEGVNNEEI